MTRSDSSGIQRQTFTIPSLLEHIYPIEQQILALARDLGFSEDDCFCLRLAMDEAMVNAIIHGNQYDCDKLVFVEVEGYDDFFTITVRDEGKGYCVKELKDPTLEENLHETHGRGVFLIRQFMSEVFFNDSGNEITFRLRRGENKPKFHAEVNN